MIMSSAIFVAESADASPTGESETTLDGRSGAGQGEVAAEAPEIRDPFFEFVVGIVEDDTLGSWSRDDLLAYVRTSGRDTKLPIEEVVSLSRTDGPDGGGRVLRLELLSDLALPLPYSILGYHPGTLHVSRLLEVEELDLGGAMLRLPDDDGEPVRIWAAGVKTLVIEAGHVVLDVDGLIDRLLGKKLDDTWIEGFVLARVHGAAEPDDDGLNGLALGRSRKGRPLSGAFDFRRDKVLPNGRPVARILALYCRRAFSPAAHPPSPHVWSWKP